MWFVSKDLAAGGAVLLLPKVFSPANSWRYYQLTRGRPFLPRKRCISPTSLDKILFIAVVVAPAPTIEIFRPLGKANLATPSIQFVTCSTLIPGSLIQVWDLSGGPYDDF